MFISDESEGKLSLLSYYVSGITYSYSWFVHTCRGEQLCTGPVTMATLMQLNYC